ncbi:MAG TPA: HAD-IA family hydrolase [Candidatus Binataceae bacterium]|nr:HAD-IA family hydrolase [Candidatus Binataceae bacterium]
MTLRAIFFDAAGTLFTSRVPVAASYAAIARRHGVEAGERDVRAGFIRAFHGAPGLAFGPVIAPEELRRRECEWWRAVVRTTFEGLGSFDNFDAFFDELFDFFAEPAHWVAFAGAPELLMDLRDRGLTLGVISNFDYRLYRILDGLGLARYFDSITISSEAGYAKPSPEIFRVAMRRHAIDPDAAIHIGDSELLDVAGARAAEIAPVLVEDRPGAPIAAAHGVIRVPTLADVRQAIAILERA